MGSVPLSEKPRPGDQRLRAALSCAYNQTHDATDDFIPERQQPVHLRPGTLNWSEDEFFEFCQANRDLRIERSAQGETTEYLGCGLRLGWLILPATARADVCTAVGVETFGSPATISAD